MFDLLDIVVCTSFITLLVYQVCVTIRAYSGEGGSNYSVYYVIWHRLFISLTFLTQDSRF